MQPPRASRANRYTLTGYTFFRSYGVILPSSLTKSHSSALGYSPYLPVSVYGTITAIAHYEAFLGGMGSISLRDKISPHRLSELMRFWIFLESPPTGLNRDIQHPDDLPFHVPPSLKRYYSGTGILTCFPSSTPVGLDLGID